MAHYATRCGIHDAGDEVGGTRFYGFPARFYGLPAGPCGLPAVRHMCRTLAGYVAQRSRACFGLTPGLGFLPMVRAQQDVNGRHDEQRE
jgi:hypothetical protein